MIFLFGYTRESQRLFCIDNNLSMAETRLVRTYQDIAGYLHDPKNTYHIGHLELTATQYACLEAIEFWTKEHSDHPRY